MTDLREMFRAGFVRRWHTNPDMCHTIDPDAYHAGRVARLIIALHPSPSAILLAACLTHDDGEIAAGDMCGEAKRKDPELADRLEVVEAAKRIDIWGMDHVACLADDDKAWLKFADRLDAYMWANFHAPHVMGCDGWPEARKRLLSQSTALGCVITDAL